MHGRCGEIVLPGAVDPCHHVPGICDHQTNRGHHVSVVILVGERTFVTSTQRRGRQTLMAQYKDIDGLWYVSSVGYDGEEFRRSDFGREMPLAIILVSGVVAKRILIPPVPLVSGSHEDLVKRKAVCVVNPYVVTAIISHELGGMMAPKRFASRSSTTASGRPCSRVITREQERAAQSAKHFRHHIPPEIQADIAKAEEGVWAEVEQGIPEADFNDLAQWIHDPGKTYGRVALYQRAITYFWAAKCLLAKMMVDKNCKEPRSGVPIPLWDLHYNDARLMHKKLDVIASKMGIKFVAPEVALFVKAASCARDGQDPRPPNA